MTINDFKKVFTKKNRWKPFMTIWGRILQILDISVLKKLTMVRDFMFISISREPKAEATRSIALVLIISMAGYMERFKQSTE